MRPLAFTLVALAASLALLCGRSHRPVAIALGSSLIAAILASAPLPRDALLVVALVPPALVVGAAWGALRRLRWWPLLAIGLVSFFAAILRFHAALDRENLGRLYAIAWAGCGILGGGACYRSAGAPLVTIAMIALVGALPAEAIAWLAWGRGIQGGYELARGISCLSLLVVVVVELVEARRRWIDSGRTSSAPAPPG